MALRTGKVIIAKNIKLDKTYKNVIDYTEANMLTLVNTNKVAESSSCSFLRPGENIIDTSFTYSDSLKCNYLALQNPSYSNKWFFAFIDEVEYINNGTTRIHYTIDIFSTWFNYIEIEPTFVVREHVNDDTIGIHTIPESLETGEYIFDNVNYYSGLDTCVYIIQCTEWASSSDNPPLATNFGGVYMAGGAYICSDIQTVVNILQLYANRGKSDAVYNLYIVPSYFVNNTSGSNQYSGQNNPMYDTKILSKPTTIDGYTPKNNKLLTFPYSYLLVSNNNGSSNILHYERFTGVDNDCKFQIKGVPTVGASIKLFPINYDISNNEEEGIIAGKFPTLNWANDEYINWLTQNSVNISIGIAETGLEVIGGLAMMTNPVTAVAGASTLVHAGVSIAEQLGSVYQHSLQPNAARGNTNGGDINVCDGKNGFYFYNMSIKREFAKIIDDYFTIRGYKINSVKTPNLTGRTYWNYVQIAEDSNIGFPNSNLYGIPATDMEEINNIFRRGVTIWHNHANIGNYALDNAIVTQ